MSICDKFLNKKILIWGYGREGKSTENFLNKFCGPSSIEILEGKREEFSLSDYDYVFKSPGIVCEENNEKIISQTEIFLEQFGSQTIGITGTKGKSTTSSMLYYVLSKTRGNTILLGNIGEPCLNYFENIDENTIVVFEMSCHQLAHVTCSPHVAVFLNLYEEHLDYYKTFNKYFEAKANITKYQKADDYFLKGNNVPQISTLAKCITINNNNEHKFELSILGNHNKYNAEFVYQIASEIYNQDGDLIRKYLKDFTGLSHRLEFVGKYNDIDYYDDSISTIPEAAIASLSAISNANTILIGGMDRGIDYSILIEYIKKHNEFNYVFMYESGARIYKELSNLNYCYLTKDLYEAVDKAGKITKRAGAIVLSPAAASYGYFKNFEERGDKFKELISSKN